MNIRFNLVSWRFRTARNDTFQLLKSCFSETTKCHRQEFKISFVDRQTHSPFFKAYIVLVLKLFFVNILCFFVCCIVSIYRARSCHIRPAIAGFKIFEKKSGGWLWSLICFSNLLKNLKNIIILTFLKISEKILFVLKPRYQQFALNIL